jgi:hypothetical protein
MAVRPVFLAQEKTPAFEEIEIQFTWHPGFARTQKEKSVRELHAAFKRNYPDVPVLEVSGKSSSPLGVALSAFNLRTRHSRYGFITVESAFQGSKVFADLGQIEQAYEVDPKTAKSIARQADSQHELVSFSWGNDEWPLEPKTLFYDWLYCSALQHYPELVETLRTYNAFTDIEFNPMKSFNCQARSCAIAVSLFERGLFEEALANRHMFVDLVYGEHSSDGGYGHQLSLV